MASTVNVRILALETLVECEKQNIFVKDYLNKILLQNQFMSKQDRAFLSRLVEGTTEYRVRLDYVINSFSKTKINKCKPVIRMILRMGVYQMLFMDSVPKEVACDECVKLAKKKGFHNLSGFVNGVLRNIARNIELINYPKREENLSLSLSIEYSMPEWIVKRFLSWYGEALTIQILEGSIETKDLTIRVNTAQTGVNQLEEKISEKGILVSKGFYVDEALHLSNINYVKRIPGFKEGEFFVQDESSMLLYESVKPYIESVLKEKQCIKVLDLCAAPGGKSTHFAQMLGKKGQIYSKDLTEQKISQINENIERLQLENIETKVGDAIVFNDELVDFADILIADLPCSGLGILGKKNDIKYHIQEDQLEELAKLQRSILENAIAYVKPGGLLLFSTCTIHPGENFENADWLEQVEGYEPFSFKENVKKSLMEAFRKENQLLLLQGREKCDGFFISVFRRKNDGC